MANEPLTATLTQGMSGTEAKALLDSLGINVNDVLSSSNIQQATTAPATKPDDLLGIRRDIYASTGVNTAQQAFQAATKAYQDAQNQLNTSNLQLRNRPVSVSKFTGQIGQNTMVNEQNINNLSDAASLALQNYQAVKSEADTQFNIRNQQLSETKALMVQYPGAGIKFSDSTESQVKKLSDYQKQVEKDAYKKELKKLALQYGINTKGKSTKELEKKIAKYNKSVIKDAKEESKLKLEALKMDILNTKSQIAERGKKGSDTEDKEVKAFESDIDKQRAILEAQTNNNAGRESWSKAWNYINSKYPGLDPETIDAALGLDYRINFEGK